MQSQCPCPTGCGSIERAQCISFFSCNLLSGSKKVTFFTHICGSKRGCVNRKLAFLTTSGSVAISCHSWQADNCRMIQGQLESRGKSRAAWDRLGSSRRWMSLMSSADFLSALLTSSYLRCVGENSRVGGHHYLTCKPTMNEAPLVADPAHILTYFTVFQVRQLMLCTSRRPKQGIYGIPAALTTFASGVTDTSSPCRT